MDCLIFKYQNQSIPCKEKVKYFPLVPPTMQISAVSMSFAALKIFSIQEYQMPGPLCMLWFLPPTPTSLQDTVIVQGTRGRNHGAQRGTRHLTHRKVSQRLKMSKPVELLKLANIGIVDSRRLCNNILFSWGGDLYSDIKK